MSKPSKPRQNKGDSAVSKPISLRPLKFKEAVADLLKVKPPAKAPKKRKK